MTDSPPPPPTNTGQQVAGYISCPKCEKRVRVRKDGMLSTHTIRRYYRSQHAYLAICPMSANRATP